MDNTSTGLQIERPSLIVVSDSIPPAGASSSSIQLLERLKITPGSEDYAVNVALAQGIQDKLRLMKELEQDIEDSKKSLIDAANLKWYDKLYSPASYRIEIRINEWISDLKIEELNREISTTTNIIHKAFTEGQKGAIRLNDHIGRMLVNREAKILLALTLAAVGAISASVIADRVLVSSVVSNVIATGIETFLFAKVFFPLNVIINAIQWTGLNSGVYLFQEKIEKDEKSPRNETMGLSNKLTSYEFANLLADPLGDTTIERLLAGRLDKLMEHGPITIELTPKM